jgi:hypothetical protein
MKKLIFIIAALASSGLGYSQITVLPNQTAAQLLSYITGSNVTVSNAALTCPPNASGSFTALNSNLGLDSGIVLTSGAAAGVAGPQSAFASTSHFAPGDSVLTIYSGTSTYDACRLDFDFVSTYDTVLFYYSFGSEEYDSYSCSNFNDAFAYFIWGPGISGLTNLALIPGTNIRVAINSTTDPAVTMPPNLGACQAMGAGSPFAQYYVNNTVGTTVTYYGLTSVFEAKAPVTIGASYHMAFVVADVMDGVLDSGVFIEGSSFTSKPAFNPNSIAAVKKDNIALSPNPFKGSLKAGLPSALMNEQVHVQMYNEVGRCVYQFHGKGAELGASLASETAQMNSGLFFMTIVVPSKGITQNNKIQKI